MASYRLSANGAAFIARFEGTVLHGYNDPTNNCTIGIGHLIHFGPCTQAELNRTITQQQALDQLMQDAQGAADCVSNNVRVPLNQNQADALISFAFNEGCGSFQSSDLLALLNQGNYGSVPSELRRWVFSSGVVLPGLVNRRNAEGVLFMSGGTTAPTSGPGQHTYTVVPGDTLSAIAARFGISTQTLYAANRVTIGANPNLIQPGMVLTIPAGAPSPTPTPTPTPNPIPGKPWYMYDICVPFNNPNFDVVFGGSHDMDVQTPLGTPIYSIVSGTIVDLSAPAWGKQIGIRLDQPINNAPYWAYLHLGSTNPALRIGGHVGLGDLIAYSGGANSLAMVGTHLNTPFGPQFINNPIQSSQPQTGMALMRGPQYGVGAGWTPKPDPALDPTPYLNQIRGKYPNGITTARKTQHKTLPDGTYVYFGSGGRVWYQVPGGTQQLLTGPGGGFLPDQTFISYGANGQVLANFQGDTWVVVNKAIQSAPPAQTPPPPAQTPPPTTTPVQTPPTQTPPPTTQPTQPPPVQTPPRQKQPVTNPGPTPTYTSTLGLTGPVGSSVPMTDYGKLFYNPGSRLNPSTLSVPQDPATTADASTQSNNHSGLLIVGGVIAIVIAVYLLTEHKIKL